MLLSGAAFGAARGPNPGHFQVFSTATRYSARNLFDHNGHRVGFPDQGKFTKTEIDTTMLYGQNDDWSWLGGLTAAQVQYENRSDSDKATVLTEARLGARRKLTESGNHLIAGQLTFLQPGWGENVRPQPGIRQNAVDARFLWDWSLWDYLHGAFFSLEAAYRSYVGTAPDQTRVEPTLLWRFDKWVPMLQWSWTRALSDGQRPNTNDIFASRSYELHKATAALAYQWAPSQHVRLGYSKDMAGRDVGGGQAVALSWWWQP